MAVFSLVFTTTRVLVTLAVQCTCKAVPEMQADMADNVLDETYRTGVNVCPRPVQNFPLKLNRKTLRGALKQFTILLKEQLEPVIEDEIEHLKKGKIYATVYRKCSMKKLSPKASRKQNKKLGIRRNKQARQLLETTWWLTSMLTTSHELEAMHLLKPGSKLISRLELAATYALTTLQEMNVEIQEGSSVCTRNTTITFPLDKTISYSDMAEYVAIAFLDMKHGMGQITKKLDACKIVVKKSKTDKSSKKGKSRRRGNSSKGISKKMSKIAKIRCKKVKSVFYKKRESRSRRHCDSRKNKLF